MGQCVSARKYASSVSGSVPQFVLPFITRACRRPNNFSSPAADSNRELASEGPICVNGIRSHGAGYVDAGKIRQEGTTGGEGKWIKASFGDSKLPPMAVIQIAEKEQMMTTNRRILIDSLPEDKLRTDNYRMHESEVPQREDDQILCKTLAISISAGTRAGLQGSAGYAGAPRTGVVMNGTTVSKVMSSSSRRIPEGSLVLCPGGWQDYSVHKSGDVRLVESGVDPAHYLGALGTNGLTAYFGLLDVGRPKPGETVLVSAAAGSVGHLVGQIARIKGCKAIGITGSDDKCRTLTDRLGFDAAVNYKHPDFRAEFKATCSNGVDVYFDNTGGDILGTALRGLNVGGRIACCGVVSQYDTSNPDPGPRGIPGLLINKRIRMQGFLVFDFADRQDEVRRQLHQWITDGDLVSLMDEFTGLENAPKAFVDLLAGGNTGTRIVRVAEG